MAVCFAEEVRNQANRPSIKISQASFEKKKQVVFIKTVEITDYALNSKKNNVLPSAIKVDLFSTHSTWRTTSENKISLVIM